MDFLKRQKMDTVFEDFEGRRKALIKALTEEKDKLFEDCDPEKDELCLFGNQDGTWIVGKPVEMLPPEHPQPLLGINFARDEMENKKWRSILAAHCDAWLFSYAFFTANQHGFDKNDRMDLFHIINDLPTICDAVKAYDEIPKALGNSDCKIRQASQKTVPQQYQVMGQKVAVVSEEEELSNEEGEPEEDNTPCGLCGGICAPEEFWISCDVCDTWFHGICVNVRSSKAKFIDKYKCPFCCNKKTRV